MGKKTGLYGIPISGKVEQKLKRLDAFARRHPSMRKMVDDVKSDVQKSIKKLDDTLGNALDFEKATSKLAMKKFD